MLYFIKAKYSGYVKIGVAINPEERLKNLQTGSWEPLLLIDAIKTKNDYAIEAEFHLQLKDSRIRGDGEWFCLIGSDKKIIEQLIRQHSKRTSDDRVNNILDKCSAGFFGSFLFLFIGDY